MFLCWYITCIKNSIRVQESFNKKETVGFVKTHNMLFNFNEYTIKPSNNNNELIRIVGSRSHLNEATKKFISKIEKKIKTEIVSKGSSLKFCLVAEGTADVYPRFAPTMEWDTAAGQAICQAVGVNVIDNKTKLPLRYNKENLLNSNFLVSV